MNQAEILHEIKALVGIWNEEIIHHIENGHFNAARTQVINMRRYLDRLYDDCRALYKGNKSKIREINSNDKNMRKPLYWAEHYSLSAERDKDYPKLVISMAKMAKKGCEEVIILLRRLYNIIDRN